MILAVAHEEFKGAGFLEVEKAVKSCAAVVDVKGILGECGNFML